MIKKIFQEIKNHPFEYILLFILLGLAFFIRIYRIDKLLGFYYDEGRDALVIWDFLHKGKLFLIGPTTGIEGIFRGPWYYWLITPFYYLGKGNPIYPSVFLAVMTVAGIGMLYYLTRQIGGKTAGFLAVFLASFSYSLVISSRGLSNLIPMYFISMLFIFSLSAFLKHKNWAIPLALFTISLAMQFGSAAEIFYIPSFFLILFQNRKIVPSKKILLFSLVIFLLPFLPQIIFDIRHQGILSLAIKKFLSDNSFNISFWEILKLRIGYYINFLSSKLWVENKILTIPFIITMFLVFIINLKTLLKNPLFKLTLIVFLLPFLGLVFFRGNNGVLYDYYLTGYYLIYILFLSVIFTSMTKYKLGKIVLFIFLLTFIFMNTNSLVKLFSTNLEAKGVITFGNQQKVINWVYQDAKSNQFNVDVYVPPVIPYAYDYLFLWNGSLTGKNPDKAKVSLLYTIYEEDNYLPSRLTAWLKRQDGIGKVLRSESFGGITVQKRIRYEKN